MDIFKNRPLAFSLFVFLCSIFISLFVTPVIKIALFSAAFILFIILCLVKRNFNGITGAFFALFFAFLLSFVYFNIFNTVYPCDNEIHSGELEIYQITYKSDELCYFNAKVSEVDGNKTDFKCKFTCYSLQTEFEVGDTIKAEFKFSEFDEANGSFDEKSYAASLGIFNCAYIDKENSVEKLKSSDLLISDGVDTVRKYCSNLFKRYTSKESAPLLISLSTGDRSNLRDSQKRDFSRLGISHMLAVSGMHLAVIMSCIGTFTTALNLSKRNSYIFVVAICIFYILLTGASASVLRSGIMFIFMRLAYFFKRQSDSLTSLFLAVSLIVIVSPSSVYDIGLILSFSATFGIIVIMPAFQKLAADGDNKLGLIFKKLVGVPVATTLSALSFSLLPMLINFDEFSLVSVIANLLLNPFITIILALIPVFIMFSWFEPFAYGIGALLDVISKAFLETVEYISGFENLTVSTAYPFIAITVIVYVLFIIVSVFIKKPKLYIAGYLAWFLVFSLTCSVYSFCFSDGSFVYYSEKGNDAILIRNQKSSVYLDFGNISKSAASKSFELLNYDMYSTELDAWLVSSYTGNEIVTLRDYLGLKYVNTVYLPVPGNDNEAVCAEEILYYAMQENTNVVFFEYGEVFEVCGSDILIDIHTNEKNKRIFSANIIYNDKSIAYYPLGYFDVCDVIYNADTVFIGCKGVENNQSVLPVFECEKLIYSDKNSSIIENIDSEKSICINKKYSFYKE